MESNLCKSDSNTRAAWIAAGLLLLAIGAVFGQTLRFDFTNYDDDFFVYNNPFIAGGLSWASLGWALKTTHCSMWGPVTWASFLLDAQLFGLDGAWGFHLTNVLLHAFTTLVLFWTIWRITGRVWPSALVAALFAIHPQHVESVAWVAERKGLLGGMFFVLTVAAYVRYVQRPFAWRNYLLVVVFFVLGLMSKPVLVTLPFLFLMLDYWPLRRIKWGERRGASGEGCLAPASTSGDRRLGIGDRGSEEAVCGFAQPTIHVPILRLFLEKIPLLLLAAASAVSAPLTQGSAVVPFDILPMSTRLANATISYVAYLGQLFWPVGLTPLYPYPYSGECPPTWQWISALTLLIVLSIAAALAWKKYPHWFVGWFWFLGTLVPMIGLVQLGSHVRADRYTYVTEIGLTLAIVWSGVLICNRWPQCRRLCVVASVAVIVALMAVSWRQTGYWQDSVVMWRHELVWQQDCSIAHANLGQALEQNHDIDGALREYRRAVEIAPDADGANNNLGWLLYQRGQKKEAIRRLAHVLDINPKHMGARNNLALALAGMGKTDRAIKLMRESLKIKPDDFNTRNNFALMLIDCGKRDEAMSLLRDTMKMYPHSAEVANKLACMLADDGRYDEAVRYFRMAMAIRPHDGMLASNLGNALYRQGDFKEAVDAWRRAIALQKGQNMWTVNQLAWAMSTCPDTAIRNGVEAVELAAWAVKLSKERNVAILATLAAAYAESGKLPDAVQTAEKATQLAAKQKLKDAATLKSLEAELTCYKSGKPFREDPKTLPPPDPKK